LPSSSSAAARANCPDAPVMTMLMSGFLLGCRLPPLWGRLAFSRRRRQVGCRDATTNSGGRLRGCQVPRPRCSTAPSHKRMMRSWNS